MAMKGFDRKSICQILSEDISQMSAISPCPAVPAVPVAYTYSCKRRCPAAHAPGPGPCSTFVLQPACFTLHSVVTQIDSNLA